MLDYLEKLSAAQAVTTTVVCTNTLVLGAAGRDIGTGPQSLGIRFYVTTAAAVAGTETYEFQIVTATAADGTTGSVVLITTGTISTAISTTRLAAGAVVDLPIPPGLIAATATHLTGKLVTANSAAITIDAYVVNMAEMENWTPFAAAVTSV